MFGLGLWEIVIIAVVAVVLIRPQDLPKILRRLGRAYGALSRLKESALSKARELESEINRLEGGRPPGETGRPTAEAGGNGSGSRDRSGDEATGDSGGLADEAAGLYRRLRQESGEDSASPKENEGKAGARRTRAAKRNLDGQGGTEVP